MAKKSRKLSLKKETLRALDGRDLEQVRGGAIPIDYVVYRVPQTLSGGCESSGCFYINLDFYRYW